MSDAWTLLGLRPTSNIKEIKKAYAQRLKRIDAAEDPKGFQALRNAFDTAKRYATSHDESHIDDTTVTLTQALQSEPENTSLSHTDAPSQATTVHDDTDIARTKALQAAVLNIASLVHNNTLEIAQTQLQSLLDSELCPTLDDRYLIAANLVAVIQKQGDCSLPILQWIRTAFDWNEHENPFQNHYPYESIYTQFVYDCESSQRIEKANKHRAQARRARTAKNGFRLLIFAVFVISALSQVLRESPVERYTIHTEAQNRGELAEATLQLERGNPNAISLLEKLALKPYLPAQLALSEHYQAKDNSLYSTPAAFWLQLASEQDPEAAARFNEQGYKRFNDTEVLFTKSSVRKNTDNSFYALGSSYYHGENDLPQDYKRAFYWLYRSAQLNNGSAQNYLGIMYANGRWATRNINKAEHWYRAAIDNGDPHASSNLAYMLFNEKKYRDALTLMEPMAKTTHGFIPLLVDIYGMGLGTGINIKAAEEWVQYAQLHATDNDIKQQSSLQYAKALITAKQLEQGYAVAKSLTAQGYLNARSTQFRAFEAGYDNLDELNAFLSDVNAQPTADDARYMAYVYLDKKLLPPNPDKARLWANKLLSQDATTGHYLLGFASYIEEDYKRSYPHFVKAAEANHAHAQKMLGDYYRYGLGVAKNIETAKSWYSRSAQNGNESAKKSLQNLN